MGMMLSPVHLCLLVSKDYFQAGLSTCYRLILRLVAMVLVLTIAYYFLLLNLG